MGDVKASVSNGSKNKKWYFFHQKLWSGPSPPTPHLCYAAHQPKTTTISFDLDHKQFHLSSCISFMHF